MTRFSLFGRVLSGTLSVSADVRLLGQAYTPDDEEDQSFQNVSGINVYQSRYKIPLRSACAGMWVLLDGLGAGNIVKSGMVTDIEAGEGEMPCVFAPIRHATLPVLKLAVEPVSPSDLPKMLDGLRSVGKSYSILETRVEESGEHVLLGTGEMYLDCVLHDLRKLYAEIDIKVADPVVRFCETVMESSSIKCVAETPNKRFVCVRASCLFGLETS